MSERYIGLMSGTRAWHGMDAVPSSTPWSGFSSQKGMS